MVGVVISDAEHREVRVDGVGRVAVNVVKVEADAPRLAHTASARILPEKKVAKLLGDWDSHHEATRTRLPPRAG
jgi:hypothetical protein